MSNPDRRSVRTGLSRRNYDQQHRSPFHRSYLESHSSDRFDASQAPISTGEYRARRQRNLSQSGTLRGAFEAVSQYPTMSENVSTEPYTLGTPNRRKQSFNHISPDSNPPNELAETYRQIDDAGNLVDQDEEDFGFSTNRFRDNRSSRSSSGSRTRGDSLFSTADADFLNEVADETLRRTLADHIKDEQRLKRATATRSPVLGKAGITAALTSENLQRRDEEDQAVFEEGKEEEDKLRPALNVPLNWGSRGTHRRDWLRNITRRTESESGRTDEGRKEASPRPSKPDIRSHTGLQDRVNEGNRNALGEPPSNRYNRIPPTDARIKPFSDQKDENLGEGSQIPNTPIMVYKNSIFNKRSPTKRDSHGLLRKLSRTESPPQSQAEVSTPENPKIPERQIYDKTPVVTGAWIDTPMTERMQELPKPRLNNFNPPRSENNSLDVPSGSGVPTIIEEPSSSELQQDNKNEILNKGEKEAQMTWGNEGESETKEREQERESAGNVRPKETSQVEDKRKEETEKQADKSKERKRPPLIKPDLPKSALETVMQDFKADKNSLDVGDDTLESLQQILDEKPSDPKTESEDDAEYEKSIFQKLELESPGSAESVDLDRLNEKLTSLTENIKKVKKGLHGLEDQVLRDAATLASIPASTKGQSSSGHSCDNCETCQAHHNGSTYAIHLPRLWRRETGSPRIRPTLLGWCSALLLLWYFSESTMCDYYCHPFIAEACGRNCLLPDAPRFPFVIPTMLWRWLHLSALWTPLWAMTMAFFRLTTQLLGISDGYVDDAPPRALNLSGEVRIRGTRVEGFPVFATSGFGAPKKQQQTQTQKPSPVAVPELDLGQDARLGGKVNWEDDSMDDDELI